VAYLTSTTDDVAIGGTDATAPFFFDTSAGNLEIDGIFISGTSSVALTTTAGYLDADAIQLTTADGVGLTESDSGLEVSDDAIGLIQGCSDGQVLKWTDGTSSWACANDSGATSAIINVESNDVAVGTDVDTLDFTSDFTLTASPSSEVNISVADDILNFTELADALSLDAATTITNGLAGDFTINLTSTGDFVLQDNGVAFATFTDGGAFIIDSLTFDGTSIASSGALSFDDNVQTTAITLSGSDDGFDSGDTALVDAINTAYGAATGGGGGLWSLTSGQVHLTTGTQNVTVGSATNLAKFGVDGDTDEVQLLVQGNATQTAN
jgi:hypothetical protein